MSDTITANFANRYTVRAEVAANMTEYDPQLLEELTDLKMREHDIEIYIV